MVHYKFTYFDVRALGEPTRMLFHLAGKEFEDNRITFNEWPALKPKTPFGKLPILEVDGVEYNQSLAIVRYLARKFGYAGKSEEEMLIVDGWAEQQREFFLDSNRPYIRSVKFEKKPVEEQEKLLDKLKTDTESWFKSIGAQLKKSGSGFVAKSGITYVDLILADNITTLIKAIPDCLSYDAEVSSYYDRVHDVPNIKKYIADRAEYDI